MAQFDVVELELEHLARKKHCILHRGPTGTCGDQVSYFVCDQNDLLLYPTTLELHGASADEAREWLLPR
ncbi:hypothetical protein [Aeoliella sp.]|uniref:hypothetical protein n=1 Tax=Aeoliella sp. TaxID=2795800 RepID=UPI003CCB86F7